MCNLYTERLSAAEIARHFGVTSALPGSNMGKEVYPGATGMVVREAEGVRLLESMTPGSPLWLESMKTVSNPGPSTTSLIWARACGSVSHSSGWRCIIPVTAFAQAEGPKGASTRTWFSVEDQPLFGWGGLWRESAKWGLVYSGAMTDCNEAIRRP